MSKYHLMSPTEAYEAVRGPGKDNESDQWVAAQREKYGCNKLKEAEERSLLAVIISNFINPITAILGAVLALACVLEEWIEAIVVVLVILLNASISIVQEYKSEKSMGAIRHLAGATMATVVRGGRTQEVPLADVVVGDVVELKQGDVVPADIRMLELSRLEIDEAVLTGESVPVIKTLAALAAPDQKDQDIAVGDRTNMAFRQTSVSQGSGRGVVVLVGENTEIGKIATRLAEGGTQKKTALTVTMERLMYFLVFVGIVFGVFIFWAFNWELNEQALLYASATLVAILPEAAIVLITVTMAISVRRMAKSNAIVRKMTALEQLGKVTDICSDKTGTLTEGKMRPARLVICQPDGNPSMELTPDGPANSRKATWSTPLSNLGNSDKDTLHEALRALVLCSSTSMVLVNERSDDLEGHGSPTELALMEMAWKITYGLSSTVPNVAVVKSGWEGRGTFDFDSKTKTMSTGWHDPSTGHSLCTVKGAPEAILPRCAGNPIANRDLNLVMSGLASQGLRVLAVAQRTDLPLVDPTADIANMDRGEVEKDLRLLALCAVRDPPKQSSITAVGLCKTAGIVVRMLTGDHPATAEAIAKEIGIIPEGVSAPGVVTTGPKLDAMSDEEIDKLPELPLIVARCSPESKVRMVEALHRRNKIVAMTGDGVNDSPSIKEADVGIAMGITGSDVTKGVADIVLADDNFATIVSAVQEGRRIFASISNFVMHLLSGNMAEAVVLLISLAYVVDEAGYPIFVLSPIAILFINTATGSGPAIGIALDKCAPDLMMRPPVKHGIFTNETIADCVIYGFLMGGMTLLAFSLYLSVIADGNLGVNCNTTQGTDCETVLEARGCSFLALNTLLLLHAYNCRHQRLPFWKSPLDNKVLIGSVIGGTLICVPLLYVPYLNDKVFKHLGGSWEWGLIAGLSVVFMILCEVYKFFKRQFLPPLTTYVDMPVLDVKVDKLKRPESTASLASESPGLIPSRVV